jgi:hypothetical protein
MRRNPIDSSLSLIQEYPVNISLSLIFSYPSKPLIDILQNPRTPFVDKALSESQWNIEFEDIYIPLFEFLLQQQIKVSVTVTGHFLDIASKKHPKMIEIMNKMITKNLLYIIPDAYWGSSYLSMYYFDWWQDEIAGTIERIQEYLDIQVNSVFIPLIYRQLPLEKLITKYHIHQFISSISETRGGQSSMKLKAFRRFHGGKVTWIKDIENEDIQISWYSNRYSFDLMNIKSHKDMQIMTKSVALEIALIATKAQITTVQSKKSPTIRIQEERNWSRYPNLDKAIFRLWEYSTYMLGKEHAEIDTIDDDPLMRNLFYSMNKDFLYYLGYEHYSKKYIMPFTSPYEAFIHIQNTIIQLEILLKERES